MKKLIFIITFLAFTCSLWSQITLTVDSNYIKIEQSGATTAILFTKDVKMGYINNVFYFTDKLSNGGWDHTIRYADIGRYNSVNKGSVGFPAFATMCDAIINFIKLGKLSVVTNQDLGSGSGGSSQWITSGSDIYYSSGKVRAGANSGDSALNVTGGLNVTRDALINGMTVGIGAGYPTNTTVGKSAMSITEDNLTTGNVAIGYEVLKNHMYGNGNTGVGALALNIDTDGEFNTAIGVSSMVHNINGSLNSGLGANSLTSNISGSYNVAVGDDVLRNNTTGSSNTAVGSAALDLNTTGYSNVAIGARALFLNTTKSNLVAVGDSALFSSTGAQFSTAIGSKSMWKTTTGASTAVGYESMYSNVGGTSNTAIGLSALRTNISGHNNTAVGHSSLYNNTGGYNTAIGGSSMYSNSSGSYNTALGQTTLLSNTSGSHNVAVGNFSLKLNVTGSYNVALGDSSGYYETGSYKMFLGCIDSMGSRLGGIYFDRLKKWGRWNGTMLIQNIPTAVSAPTYALVTETDGLVRKYAGFAPLASPTFTGVVTSPKFKQTIQDTAGIGSTANIGMTIYQASANRFYGLKSGLPPYWSALDRPYKVYTANISQYGPPKYLVSGPLIIGERYMIESYIGGDDFTNVGALSNTQGVSFIATGDTAASWHNSTLSTDGSPIVNVIENTIGNIEWSYTDVGKYMGYSFTNAFTLGKTAFFTGGGYSDGGSVSFFLVGADKITMDVFDSAPHRADAVLLKESIEIRVYQ